MFFMYMSVLVTHVHVLTEARKKALYPLELESQVVLNCLT